MTRRGLLIILCALSLWLAPGSAGPALAHLPTEAPGFPAGLLSDADLKLYAEAFAAAERGHWTSARRLAAKAEDPLPAKVIAWMYLSRAGTSAEFDEIARFIDDNPHWPNQRTLLQRAEEALSDDVPDRRVLAWFAEHPPVSGEGRVRAAEAFMRNGWPELGRAWLRYAWVVDDFGARREREILRRHRDLLDQADHEARLDRLLWDGNSGAARRMLRRVSPGFQALAEARLRLMQQSGGVDPAIARVPVELKDHPGLVYERLRWRRRKGFDESARELLFDPPDDIVRPEIWWVERAILARKALEAGAISEAYRLASEHGQSDGASFAEAEWLSGWIALRFLDDAEAAYQHFERLYARVRFPTSRARGAYWAGRAAEARGDDELARQWYGKAAQHRTVFYGQLAAHSLERAPGLSLTPDPVPEAGDVEAFEALELVRVVRLLAELDRRKLLRPFVMALNQQAETAVEHVLVARLAESLRHPNLAVAAAKRSARAGVAISTLSYPLIALPQKAGPERALLLAVSRQESEFDAKAVSGRGARGLMQLMPSTAKVVAKRLRVRYVKAKLTDDPVYNVTLGSAYLGELIDDFDGSYVLALAAYNAGPSRVKRWLREFGDPRMGEVDMVDWIELIPFSETRNYVQRVLEGLQVYRHRLDGEATPLRLQQDLGRPGGLRDGVAQACGSSPAPPRQAAAC